MGHRFGWVAAGVVAVAALAVGAVGYNIGGSHGLALAAPAAGAAGAVPYMWHRPWGFGFGPLFVVLLFLLVFRPLLCGGFYRRRGFRAHACGVPPRFEEWHRRAHAQMNDQQAQPPAESQHRA